MDPPADGAPEPGVQMSGSRRGRVPPRSPAGPPRTSRRRTAAWLLVGLALVGSFAVPWTGSGPGSTVTGFGAVALVGSGAVAAWVPAWAAVPLALLPACGLGVVLTASGTPAAARTARSVAFGLAAATCPVLAVPVWWSPSLTSGPGLWVAVTAVVAGLVLAVAPRLARAVRTIPGGKS